MPEVPATGFLVKVLAAGGEYENLILSPVSLSTLSQIRLYRSKSKP